MNRAFWLLTGLSIFMVAQPAFGEQGKTIATIALDTPAPAGVPICVPLSIPEEFAKTVGVFLSSKGGDNEFLTIGQLTLPSLPTEKIPASGKGLVRRDLHFWPEKNLQGQITVIATFAGGGPAGFFW